MRHPTPIERRLGAVMLLVLLLALGYLVLVHWWLVTPLVRMNGQMQSLREDQQRYAAIVAQRDELQQHLSRLARDRSGAHVFLPGNDANAASASLMQQVVDAVAAHVELGPCKITRKVPMLVRKEIAGAPSAYREVSASLSLRCGMHVLAGVLHDLAERKPYVFVDTLSIYRDALSGKDGSVLPLHVKMVVSGYMLMGVAEASR